MRWSTPQALGQQNSTQMAGCRTPIQPGRSQLLITERQPYIALPFTGLENAGYILQTKSGNMILGIDGKPNDSYAEGLITLTWRSRPNR